MNRLLLTGPSRPHVLTKRLVVVCALPVVLLLGLGVGAAEAHINPKPSVVKAGSKTAVSFTVGHACGKKPTTKLQIKVPAEVTVTNPKGPANVTATLDNGVVSFAGTFTEKSRTVSITAQFPKTLGVLHFPIVQTCSDTKLSWIEIPNNANPKPNYPAPQITVK